MIDKYNTPTIKITRNPDTTILAAHTNGFGRIPNPICPYPNPNPTPSPPQAHKPIPIPYPIPYPIRPYAHMPIHPYAHPITSYNSGRNYDGISIFGDSRPT